MLVILSGAKSRYIGILDESGNLAVEMLPFVPNDIVGRGSENASQNLFRSLLSHD